MCNRTNRSSRDAILGEVLSGDLDDLVLAIGGVHPATTI